MFLFAVFFTLLLLITYLLIIIWWIKGWKKISRFKSTTPDVQQMSVSVVVCCKNEEKNLPELVQSLINQSYKNFELILVDDHSTDNTPGMMRFLTQDFCNCKIIESAGSGKKQALKSGIAATTGEIIIISDADCTAGQHWLSSMLDFFFRYQPDLLLGQVALSSDKTLWQNIQQTEFAALVASGMASAANGYPIYGNASNMLFTKLLWNESSAFLKEEYISGDDVFLIQQAFQSGKKILVCRDDRAIVETKPKENLKEFLNQRRRWLSKSTGYRGFYPVFVTLLVALLNLWILILIPASIFSPFLLWMILLLFSVKFLLDHQFLSLVKPFYRQKNNLITNFCLSVLYPFYVLITGLMVLTGNNKKW